MTTLFKKHLESKVIFLEDVTRKDGHIFLKGSKAKITKIYSGYPRCIQITDDNEKRLSIENLYVCKANEKQTSFHLIKITEDASIDKSSAAADIIKRINAKIDELNNKIEDDVIKHSEYRGSIKAYEQVIKMIGDSVKLRTK